MTVFYSDLRSIRGNKLLLYGIFAKLEVYSGSSTLDIPRKVRSFDVLDFENYIQFTNVMEFEYSTTWIWREFY